MPWSSRIWNYVKRTINRSPTIKGYAKNILESLQKFKSVIIKISLESFRFLKNLLLIFVLTIRRGVKLLFINVLDTLKAAIRGIIDLLRWPLEHLVYPVIHWLADRTEDILRAIEGRDGVALGCFFVFIILCGLISIILTNLF